MLTAASSGTTLSPARLERVVGRYDYQARGRPVTWRRRGLPMAATLVMLAVMVALGLCADRAFRASLDTRERIGVDELAAS